MDEPGLDLEPADDSNEGDIFNDLDTDSSNALECDMVYVLSAKYALPEIAYVCPIVYIVGEDDSQLIPKQEDSTLWRLIMY